MLTANKHQYPVAGPSRAGYSFTADSHSQALPLEGALFLPLLHSPTYVLSPNRSMNPNTNSPMLSPTSTLDKTNLSPRSGHSSRGSPVEATSSEAGDEWEEVSRRPHACWGLPPLSQQACFTPEDSCHHSRPTLPRLDTSTCMQSTRPPTPQLYNQPSSHFSDSDSSDDLSSEVTDCSDDVSHTEDINHHHQALSPPPKSTSPSKVVISAATEEIWKKLHTRLESTPTSHHETVTSHARFSKQGFVLSWMKGLQDLA